MTALHDEELGLSGPESEPLLRKSNEPEVLECGGADILQFSSPMFFADEVEGTLSIDIIRLGGTNGRIGASFYTEDNSAKSGMQYWGVSGQVVFEDGEYIKTIAVPILDDNTWSATLEFRVRLASPKNCLLGTHLDNCRVMILNSEAFPSDMHKDKLRQGPAAIKKINPWVLFFQYCILNFNAAGQQAQTLLVLIGDQLNSIAVFGTLWVGVFMIDTLFVKNASAEERLLVPDRIQKYNSALLIALWYVIPVIVLFTWDTLKATMDIKGASREYLQKSLMRTSLDYTPESRNIVTIADMNVAMGLSAEQLATGYVAALNSVGILGRIVAIVVFIVMFQHDPLAIHSVIAATTLLIMFTTLRAGAAQRAQEHVDERWLLMETLVEETHTKFRLISDYSKRGLMSDMFSLAAEAFSSDKIAEILIHLNTTYATRFITGCCVANYIAQRTVEVLDGSLSLGIFLATVTVFSVYLSDAIMALNDELMLIVESLLPLTEFSHFLNLELELNDRKRINRSRREHTTKQRAAIISGLKHAPIAKVPTSVQTDVVAIMVSDLAFEYITDIPVLKNVNFSIPQGHLVAVMGPQESGKATFVQIMANILLPTSGGVFVPAHLRFLHVSREPIFLHASLIHNLALGLPDPTALDSERAMSILKLLGLQNIVDIVADDFKTEQRLSLVGKEDMAGAFIKDEISFMHATEASWERAMSQSHKIKLHVARALIADPEVMILDRTLQGLHTDSAQDVINVLRQHVSEKGLCYPKDSKAARRPRTVFFSTTFAAQASSCDYVLQMDADRKTIELSQQQASLMSRLTSRGEVGCVPKR